MLGISILTLAEIAVIAALSVGATTSTVSANVTATMNNDRGYHLAKISRSQNKPRHLRVINRRCAKYLVQFQRTGDDYFLRVYRECIRR